MGTTPVYYMTQEDREEFADFIKTVIISALIQEELIKQDEADIWCRDHTVIGRNKNIFRTISDKFKKIPEDKDSKSWLVVKKI